MEITPNVAMRQTYYTKDMQGATREGKHDVLSGQFSAGADASLKLFRVFPVATNVLGVNVERLRHVLTPTVSYAYFHEPTVPNGLLSFPVASGPSNIVTFGVENKLQAKRAGASGQLRMVELARGLVSLPYTFQSSSNKEGGQLGDWGVDLEAFPWPWFRLETDFTYPSHFVKSSRDSRIQRWNLDLIMVGGRRDAAAYNAPDILTPAPAFQVGPKGGLEFMPLGQWYLGLGHRYSYNDKTEDVVQWDWRLSDKWEIGTFHRLTMKEVIGNAKRFWNMREYQYRLRRDLHDWVGELVYRVDREYGEEVFFMLTLKAYPDMPIELGDSYHQPKVGSQSSPFSPVPAK